MKYNLPQTFSSDPSLQSALPSQKSSLLMQTRSPQASLLVSSGPHTGSSVTNKGLAFFSFCSLSQFVTAAFQSHVCFSRSKASPGGHRICWRPYGEKESIRTFLLKAYRIVYRSCALDHISAIIFSCLKSKHFTRAFPLTKLVFSVIILSEDSWKIYKQSTR